jgi:CobQ-like glutamine amidotransferase family enzyme
VERTRLTIHHLYADMMNLYGDRGNVISIRKRCEWRGIPVDVVDVGLGERVRPTGRDLFSSAGGRTASRPCWQTTSRDPRAPIFGPSWRTGA